MRVAYSIVLLTGLTFAGFSVATVDVVAQDVRESVDFTRDVRPILSNACFHCHGPDEDTREAELRLDQRDGLFEHRDEYTIVNPGDHSGSELIRRILSQDPDEVMPPRGLHQVSDRTTEAHSCAVGGTGSRMEGTLGFCAAHAVRCAGCQPSGMVSK